MRKANLTLPIYTLVIEDPKISYTLSIKYQRDTLLTIQYIGRNIIRHINIWTTPNYVDGI